MTIKWGIIGCGDVAEHKGGPALYGVPGSELVAVMRRDAAKAADFCQRHGAKRWHTRVQDLLADPEVNAAYVATPVHLHCQQTIQSAEAGKHILCEKPLTTDLEEARALVDLVYEQGICLAVGNVLRYVPQFALALDYARHAKLGELFFVEADYIHDMRPVFQRTPWRVDPQQPQNAIFGGGVHPIDLLRQVGGPVAQVFAYGNAKALPEYNSDDSILISLRFANGCVGKVWVTFGVRQRPHNRINLGLYGTQGSVQANSQEAQVRLYQEGMAPGQADWATIPLTEVQGHPVREELENLVEAIRWGRPTRVRVVDGARTVAIMAAAQASLEQGAPMPVEEIAAPPSLSMLRPHLNDLPSAEPPQGYAVRT